MSAGNTPSFCKAASAAPIRCSMSEKMFMGVYQARAHRFQRRQRLFKEVAAG
jgi:hypothetical protein